MTLATLKTNTRNPKNRTPPLKVAWGTNYNGANKNLKQVGITCMHAVGDSAFVNKPRKGVTPVSRSR